jgi:hypothetical protein
MTNNTAKLIDTAMKALGGRKSQAERERWEGSSVEPPIGAGGRFILSARFLPLNCINLTPLNRLGGHETAR